MKPLCLFPILSASRSLSGALMRLLNTKTLQFEQFFDSNIPRYSILSHRWSNDEVTYEQFLAGATHHSRSYEKIINCCRISRANGFDYTWIDCCCIDKRSSAELSEAINSMFNWYQRSQICYVFLPSDSAATNVVQSNLDSHFVQALNEPDSATLTGDDMTVSFTGRFQSNSWFSRGWTLQELLAPSKVDFYDAEYNSVGNRSELAAAIADITGIDARYLREPEREGKEDLRVEEMLKTSFATRMFWASRRETSRPEDMAYCLLGLFNVNIPLLYGEGAVKAFMRLQRECFLRGEDDSMFVWDRGLCLPVLARRSWKGLLAPGPEAFQRSAIVLNNDLAERPTLVRTINNLGLELELPIPTVSMKKIRSKKPIAVIYHLRCYGIPCEDCESPRSTDPLLSLQLQPDEDTGKWIALPGCGIGIDPSLNSKNPVDFFHRDQILKVRQNASRIKLTDWQRKWDAETPSIRSRLRRCISANLWPLRRRLNEFMESMPNMYEERVKYRAWCTVVRGMERWHDSDEPRLKYWLERLLYSSSYSHRKMRQEVIYVRVAIPQDGL